MVSSGARRASNINTPNSSGSSVSSLHVNDCHSIVRGGRGASLAFGNSIPFDIKDLTTEERIYYEISRGDPDIYRGLVNRRNRNASSREVIVHQANLNNTAGSERTGFIGTIRPEHFVGASASVERVFTRSDREVMKSIDASFSILEGIHRSVFQHASDSGYALFSRPTRGYEWQATYTEDIASAFGRIDASFLTVDTSFGWQYDALSRNSGALNTIVSGGGSTVLSYASSALAWKSMSAFTIDRNLIATNKRYSIIDASINSPLHDAGVRGRLLLSTDASFEWRNSADLNIAYLFDGAQIDASFDMLDASLITPVYRHGLPGGRVLVSDDSSFGWTIRPACATAPKGDTSRYAAATEFVHRASDASFSRLDAFRAVADVSFIAVDTSFSLIDASLTAPLHGAVARGKLLISTDTSFSWKTPATFGLSETFAPSDTDVSFDMFDASMCSPLHEHAVRAGRLATTKGVSFEWASQITCDTAAARDKSARIATTSFVHRAADASFASLDAFRVVADASSVKIVASFVKTDASFAKTYTRRQNADASMVIVDSSLDPILTGNEKYLLEKSGDSVPFGWVENNFTSNEFDYAFDFARIQKVVGFGNPTVPRADNLFLYSNSTMHQWIDGSFDANNSMAMAPGAEYKIVMPTAAAVNHITIYHKDLDEWIIGSSHPNYGLQIQVWGAHDSDRTITNRSISMLNENLEHRGYRTPGSSALSFGSDYYGSTLVMSDCVNKKVTMIDNFSDWDACVFSSPYIRPIIRTWGMLSGGTTNGETKANDTAQTVVINFNVATNFPVIELEFDSPRLIQKMRLTTHQNTECGKWIVYATNTRASGDRDSIAADVQSKQEYTKVIGSLLTTDNSQSHQTNVNIRIDDNRNAFKYYYLYRAGLAADGLNGSGGWFYQILAKEPNHTYAPASSIQKTEIRLVNDIDVYRSYLFKMVGGKTNLAHVRQMYFDYRAEHEGDYTISSAKLAMVSMRNFDGSYSHPNARSVIRIKAVTPARVKAHGCSVRIRYGLTPQFVTFTNYKTLKVSSEYTELTTQEIMPAVPSPILDISLLTPLRIGSNLQSHLLVRDQLSSAGVVREAIVTGSTAEAELKKIVNWFLSHTPFDLKYENLSWSLSNKPNANSVMNSRSGLEGSGEDDEMWYDGGPGPPSRRRFQHQDGALDPRFPGRGNMGAADPVCGFVDLVDGPVNVRLKVYSTRTNWSYDLNHPGRIIAPFSETAASNGSRVYGPVLNSNGSSHVYISGKNHVRFGYIGSSAANSDYTTHGNPTLQYFNCPVLGTHIVFSAMSMPSGSIVFNSTNNAPKFHYQIQCCRLRLRSYNQAPESGVIYGVNELSVNTSRSHWSELHSWSGGRINSWDTHFWAFCEGGSDSSDPANTASDYQNGSNVPRKVNANKYYNFIVMVVSKSSDVYGFDLACDSTAGNESFIKFRYKSVYEFPGIS